MSTDRDVTSRIVRSWLHEDAHEDADRILNLVLDQIDTAPQRRAGWLARRFPPMNSNFVRVAAVVAAVVVIAVVAFNYLPGSDTPGGEPSTSPKPSAAEPSVEPSTTAWTGLPEGPYLLADGQGDTPETAHPPLTVTIPGPGWNTGEQGNPEGVGILLNDWNDGGAGGAGMIIFASGEYLVYGDPCNWATTIPDTPVTTVDEFVAALTSQPSRDASEPVDITLGGYTGKSITLHIPDDADFSQCDEGTFGSWDCGNTGDTPCGFHSGPGETDIEYILDVDGLLVAWHTGYEAGASADVVTELEAIVQSANFGN
jgi:hypothetical protein